jgi:hypothetical protein
MSEEKQKSRKNEVGGLVFVGCLLIGLAVGFLLGNAAVGILGGLGVGFIALAIALASGGQESPKKGASGAAFVGCLMLGLAAGMLTGNTAVGVLAGLGIGFIVMAIVRYSTGQW